MRRRGKERKVKEALEKEEREGRMEEGGGGENKGRVTDTLCKMSP